MSIELSQFQSPGTHSFLLEKREENRTSKQYCVRILLIFLSVFFLLAYMNAFHIRKLINKCLASIIGKMSIIDDWFFADNIFNGYLKHYS